MVKSFFDHTNGNCKVLLVLFYDYWIIITKTWYTQGRIVGRFCQRQIRPIIRPANIIRLFLKMMFGLKICYKSVQTRVCKVPLIWLGLCYLTCQHFPLLSTLLWRLGHQRWFYSLFDTSWQGCWFWELHSIKMSKNALKCIDIELIYMPFLRPYTSIPGQNSSSI